MRADPSASPSRTGTCKGNLASPDSERRVDASRGLWCVPAGPMPTCAWRHRNRSRPGAGRTNRDLVVRWRQIATCRQRRRSRCLSGCSVGRPPTPLGVTGGRTVPGNPDRRSRRVRDRSRASVSPPVQRRWSCQWSNVNRTSGVRYPPASRIARPHGSIVVRRTSMSSPRTASAGASALSVRSSMSSRTVRPRSVS